MDRFIMQHRERIVGTLSCLDRPIFEGRFPISHPTGPETFLGWSGLRLEEQAQATAEHAGRPQQYLSRPARKEDLAREILQREGLRRAVIRV